MGNAPVADIPDASQRLNRPVEMPLTAKAGEAGFRSFEILDLAAETNASPTAMREEILLLSWLIVLLKTQEGNQIKFEWTYKSDAGKIAAKACLSSDRVMASLQDRLGNLSAAILDHLAQNRPTVSSRPTSLLLSTGLLSQTSEEPQDEGVLHLKVCFGDGQLNIHPDWHTKSMLSFTLERYVDVLTETIRMCISNPDMSIQDCLRPTARDLDDIWGWNHELPPTHDFCMHEMISKQAEETPDKEAISAWDGGLTYAQIDRYSTFAAHCLKDAGVKVHDIVPACFDKSRWTIVAVLAIMKAGATFALMDPTLPLARLQNMATQVRATTMLTSRRQHALATTIFPHGTHLTIDASTFAHLTPTTPLPSLPAVPTSALMYIIFTSGSTGTPKGVTISHATYTSSALPRARAVGYGPSWRVLDFASYAFDVSIDSMLLTTAHGGTLCIPSDAQRLDDINGAMRGLRVNYAGVTPSVARILEPDVIASLHALGLGGEAAAARDVTEWGKRTRIVIGYGPCECTIGCTVNGSAATGREYVSIGTGNGAKIWIVDPDDQEKLVPVGAVGELLVEGPIVGQGYLNDPEKTAAAFIEDPAWLAAGWKGYTGRKGRLYKTGDLGKYDPDGSGGIVFAGRKDTQVKLRGQRVELGEIESQLRSGLPSDVNVTAEVIVPQGTGGQSTLVAFVASQTSKGKVDREICAVQLPGDLWALLSKADAELVKAVPRYMVPTAYIPVNHIPVLISGKTDRKRLRQFGQMVDLRQLDQDTTNTNRELSDLEKRLRQAWSEVLKIDAENIRVDDNLFALGGDSLAAMRLVSVCRAQGLDLSVTNTFANPTLSAMASVVRIIDFDAQNELAPFSMISQDVESARIEASLACETDPSAIEDIYPSTPTQQSLFTFALKSTKAYIAQRVARIPSHIDLDAWKKAWEGVVAANPILRSRLAQLQEPGLQQVVLKENISWRQSNDLAQYLEEDRKEKMGLGQGLARYAIVTPPHDDSARYMVWTIHHVLYDGWSEPLVLEQVKAALHHQASPVPAQMRDFVAWLRSTPDATTHEFWRQELRGAVGPQFPRLPSRDYLPTPNALLERHIPLETGHAGSPFTTATLLRAAWAFVASQHAGTDDVVFGETLTGRDVALRGIDSIIGPLIATVPVRVRVRRTASVEEYLKAVQEGVLERTPHQHIGFQNIRRVSQDAQIACETGTGLVIQPEPEYVGDDLGFEHGDVVREALHFNAYPVMLAFGIRKGGVGGVRVCASFDKSLVDVAAMRRILAQLEVVCLELSKSPLSRRLGQITCLPEAELDQIWRWNQTPPLSFDESTQCLRAESSSKPGSVYPRAAVPWVCDPKNPSLLSPIGCVGELWLEGAYLPGETVESPAWLLAGSLSCKGRTGRVQSTEDMVQLQPDGSLLFVRRKDEVLTIQGHAVGMGDLEAHFTKHLPPSVYAAAAIWQSSNTNQQIIDQELVVFVEQPIFDATSVAMMPAEREITHDGTNLHIRSNIPTGLAVALKKLDKSIHNSLNSYMVPFAYVVVDKLPVEKGQALNKVASAIPRPILIQLREDIREAWKNTALQATLTAAEDVLRSSWAKILGIAPEQIDVDDNFFRLGGDSVLAMKLVSSLRAQGHSLSVADIFSHMRLGDAAKVMKSRIHSPIAEQQTYRPFSSLGDIDVGSFLSDFVRPKLADQRWIIQDVYPVTDSQALDIKATIQAPRTSVQYTMLYFNESIDSEQLSQACRKLFNTHDILRTVFILGATKMLQVVLSELETPMFTQKTDQDLEQHVVNLCKTDIETGFSLGTPFLKFFHIRSTTSPQSCLILRLSHAQYDGISLPRLLSDLSALYTGAGTASPFSPYSTYISRTHSSPRATAAALAYWRSLLAHSTLSTLPRPTPVHPTDKALFLSTPIALSANRPPHITPATLLTAAWALVLARRLRTPDVTFGSITSGCTALDAVPEAMDAVGPCYQFTPVRVRFAAAWSAADVLQHVQAQSAASAAWDWVGFERIAGAECAGWAAADEEEGEKGERTAGEVFFDSVVHHQDAGEDFDEMDFGGGKCRVDVCKPHGDAARPLKVVSFVKGGDLHLGVVGSEREPVFVEEVLGELIKAVEELSESSEQGVLLKGDIFSTA